MQPRDILAPPLGAHEFGGDGVEIERGGIDPACARRAPVEDLGRHERAGIEADRAALDEVAAAHRDQIGRAGAGADEVNGHVGVRITAWSPPIG